MVEQVTLHRYGHALGTTLPKTMTDRLKLSAGDKVYAVETEHGILLTPVDPALISALEAGERISNRYRNALRELAE